MKRAAVFIASFIGLGLLIIGSLVVVAPWADGPISRIAGGPFSQPAKPLEELDPFSLTDASGIDLEVDLASRPSVRIAVLVHADTVYLPATLNPHEKRWPRAILANSAVRIRTNDQVFEAEAYRVEDPKLHKTLSELGAQKYSTRYFKPENTWFFELAERSRN